MRVLLLRLGAVSADSGPARRRGRRRVLLYLAGDEHSNDGQLARLGSMHTNSFAWWLPHAAILAGLFVPVSVRAVIWIIGLVWMGAACILNARWCNRTHCRCTGPYYLAMTVPVMALGAGYADSKETMGIRPGCLLRKRFDLGGQHGEAAPGISGARRLDGRVQRQQVGLPQRC